MKDWMSANWPYLIIALLYILERTTAISANFASKLRVLVSAIENVYCTNSEEASADVIQDVKQKGLNHDPDIDAALDIVKPKNTPRISKGRRFLRGAMKVLPLVSRFMP